MASVSLCLCPSLSPLYLYLLLCPSAFQVNKTNLQKNILRLDTLTFRISVNRDVGEISLKKTGRQLLVLCLFVLHSKVDMDIPRHPVLRLRARVEASPWTDPLCLV